MSTSIKGIRRTDTGWRVYGRFHGQFFSKRFPLDTPLTELRAWREDERVRLRAARAAKADPAAMKAPGTPTTLREDAAIYLAAVKAMPSYADRVRDIDLWVREFGDRERHTIAPVEIRAVRDRWLTVGPRLVQQWVTRGEDGKKRKTFREVKGPLSASTVNHRLRALENLYTVLDRQGRNPVRDVPEVPEPNAPPRAIPLELVRAILGAMADTPTRARCAVLAWTGLPHAALARLTAADVDWKRKVLVVPGRAKGAGTAGRLLPLTAEGVQALRDLDRHQAWGRFSRSTLHRAFRRACAAIDVTGAHPYDLRHSAATMTLSSTGDLRATQLLMGHASAKTTERYAAAAIPPALAAAAAKLSRAQRAGQPRRPTR